MRESSFELEERHAMSKRSFDVSLVGGFFPGWFESTLLLVFFPGMVLPWCALCEGSQRKGVCLSVCCESLPTLQVQASTATARVERAYAVPSSNS